MSAANASELAASIAELRRRISRAPISIMEVCGTHTVAIYRHGLRSLLPEGVRLVSGPGCPVCVTAQSAIDQMLWLANGPERIVATFGDMTRVPGSNGSLAQARARGEAQVRVVYSPIDAVQIAQESPGKEVVFLGVGFETTAPAIAAAIIDARRRSIRNFTVACAFKLVPPALEALLAGGKTRLDGLLCPGHVSVIIGSDAYKPAAERYSLPCSVAGFEPVEILKGIESLLRQLAEGRAEVENCYAPWVRPGGNAKARGLMEEVFEPEDAQWRGLGWIPASGLRFRPEWAEFDAVARFGAPRFDSPEPPGCRCGEVLAALAEPFDCPLFRRVCSPDNPVGPCMVSSEGACAAAHAYGGGDRG